MKGPVILRRRLLPSGNTSLYLDIYVSGRRRTEALKLFLVPELTKADRKANEETLRLAEDYCARRRVEVRDSRYGFRPEASGSVLVLPYFDQWLLSRSAQLAPSTAEKYGSVRAYIKRYDGREALRFSDIDAEWCGGLAESMTTGLRGRAQNDRSRSVTWTYFKVFIHAAVSDGLLPRDPTKGLHPCKVKPANRNYLTLDELKSLVSTPEDHDNIRRMFLFSCFTGLRLSDIEKLTWNEVSADALRITFRQKKTGGLEYLDINPQAAELMGVRSAPDDRVFHPETQRQTMNSIIREWAARAGIRKHLSFHCARHTFATLMLTLGTDLYTVSKLLGHSYIAVTQIYAKIIDEKKKDAVNRIPKIL